MKSDAVPHSLTIGHAGTIGSATRSSSIGFFHAGLVEAIMKTPFDDLTVLVVEDDWFAREDIAHAFRQEGWTVLVAATGEGVLQLLRQARSIDLLVTDIDLGNDAMTGWDVAEAVRKKHPEVPVIYASGGLNNERRRVPKSVFLSKPVDTNELMLTCSKLRSTVQ
jgi:CheY-like chemotaxis protein